MKMNYVKLMLDNKMRWEVNKQQKNFHQALENIHEGNMVVCQNFDMQSYKDLLGDEKLCSITQFLTKFNC